MAFRCGWTAGVAEKGSRCEWRPRTCAECLNVALTTGESCALSSSGICVSQRTNGNENEASTTPGLIRSNETSYCSATDPQCAVCRPPMNTSSVCIGTDSCVCLSACEAPEWQELVTEQLLHAAYTQQSALEDHDACLFPESGAKALPLGSPQRYNDLCAWDHSQSQPRSCYDCLNAPLASGQSCTITPSGLCAAMDPSIHYYFASVNATYCEPGDKGCTQCLDPVGDSSPLFCVGLNDCVCTTQCEWRHRMQQQHLPVNGSWSMQTETSAVSRMLKDTNPLIEPLKKFIIFLGVLFPTAVIALLIWSWRMGLLCNNRSESSRSPPRLGPLLELNAWKQLRDTLIEEEARKSARGRSTILLTPGTAPHLPITLDPIEDDETKSDGEYHEYEPPTTTVVVE